MITFFVMLRTKDPPPMFDRKPIQLVFSSRTSQATDGSLRKETTLKIVGDHIQDVVVVVVITSKRGLAEIRAWKDLTYLIYMLIRMRLSLA